MSDTWDDNRRPKTISANTQIAELYPSFLWATENFKDQSQPVKLFHWELRASCHLRSVQRGFTSTHTSAMSVFFLDVLLKQLFFFSL